MTAEDHTTDKTAYGFWVYIMTDCILFSILFATYGVFCNSTAGGPSSKELFSLPYALVETLLLLVSSLTCGLSWLGTHRNKPGLVVLCFALTFLLGLGFIGMELNEFHHFIQSGNSWERSAFLSSFFTLVGTHGLHISIGLIWMLVMFGQIWRWGLNTHVLRRLACLRLFWHFLDFVWIFIFTIVYLIGGQ